MVFKIYATHSSVQVGLGEDKNGQKEKFCDQGYTKQQVGSDFKHPDKRGQAEQKSDDFHHTSPSHVKPVLNITRK